MIFRHRVWDKGLKRMCMVRAIYYDDPPIKPTIVYWTDSETLKEGSLNDVEIMSYIGYITNDGEEACESDIVTIDLYYPRPIGIIVWQGYGFYVRAFDWFVERVNTLYLSLETFKTLRILGNPFENPELVES